MTKGCVQICHSDETLAAEVIFWAKSAGYDIEVEQIGDPAQITGRQFAAAILELSGNSDSEVDNIEKLSRQGLSQIIVITELDEKTVASIRRLFEQKSIKALITRRQNFSTRMLADVIRLDKDQNSLSPAELSKAIQSGGVVVHYQPKVPFNDLTHGFGVEALCRLQHPLLGLIFPDNFIPLAEMHGLIGDLTDAVTIQAFRDLETWDKQGRQLRLALNVSPQLMSSMTWFEQFERRCVEYRVDPKRITLEVTESSSQGGKALALEILSRLRLKGFTLSIDDFGTGFSSLETLYKLPFGELKIDKGFIFDFHKSTEARTLVETTINLARKLGLKITAEGVENEQVFEELRKLQCDDAQGYYISKAIAAEQIVPFFASWEGKTEAAVGQFPRLKIAQGLLAEILSFDQSDDDDATVVLSGTDPKRSGSLKSASRIPPLLLAGDLVGSLALCHEALSLDPDETVLRAKLTSLRSELEQSIGRSSIILCGKDREVHIQSGDNFIVGRESATAGSDIAIPCRWLSRGSKNLRLFRKGTTWHVTDLGSTNGHFIEGERLSPNKPLALPVGETRLEVGKRTDQSAPAWLVITVEKSGSAEISFGAVDCDLKAARMRWRVFADKLTMDSIQPTDRTGANRDAKITSRDGALWISPEPGRTIALAGHEFSTDVPLTADCLLRVGPTLWELKSTFTEIGAQPVKATA